MWLLPYTRGVPESDSESRSGRIMLSPVTSGVPDFKTSGSTGNHRFRIFRIRKILDFQKKFRFAGFLQVYYYKMRTIKRLFTTTVSRLWLKATTTWTVSSLSVSHREASPQVILESFLTVQCTVHALPGDAYVASTLQVVGHI